MTQKTSRNATGSSIGLTRTPRTAASSTTQASDRFHDAAYRREYFSHPAYDFAEAIIGLRHLRGVNQGELARRLGTHQPAIARLESGEGNPRLSTLVDTAHALGARVRLQIILDDVL